MFVVYEDPSILLVNKPSGLVVNRSDTWEGDTLEDQLRKYFSLADNGIGGRAGIVHRLDKDTSGLLLIAKKEKAFEKLLSQFKNREVEKGYFALSYGKVKPERGVIDAPIDRNPKQRRKMAVVEGGRSAVTEFVVQKYFEKGGKHFTLLELYPKTGRTHQLRVHLAAFNHALVGDPLYSGDKRFRRDKEWCPRLFLHAFSLRFRHPETGEFEYFEIGLPEELLDVLEGLVV
ncbi:MAG: RluA family pseudouridine synthase [Patescibacteria group bacterium]|nr:RluA family pseudouridine synthase [Patescibacteria group bacterium]